jgi:2-polyprenyl-3-methyl-5-hydroxy-6-metoxy-1,4-benzoquinol methylase
MEHVVCNLCGADDTVVRYPSTLQRHRVEREWLSFACTYDGYGRHHAIVQCRQCGMTYTNPRLDKGDILDAYAAVEDPLYVEEREGRVLTFERHLKPLERITGPPNGRPLLDVGCYTGVFVEIAERHGWEAWGLEPSRWAVKQARARGLDVIQGTLTTASLPEAYFEVVTLWDVIEHLTDPCKALQQAHHVLRPGGLVVIHTIDIESPFARLLGERWPWLMEMHLYYFSRQTLRVMLGRCSFEVISIRPQGRYLRLGYLMSRLRPLVPTVGRSAEWLVTRLGLRGLAVPLNLGDLSTAYARKVCPPCQENLVRSVKSELPRDGRIGMETSQ